MTPEEIKIIEGKTRVKVIDEQILALSKQRERITAWLAKQKQLIFPAGKTEIPKEEYTAAFEELWRAYPARDGVKREKAAAFARFKKIRATDYPALKKAVFNYALSREAVSNAARDMVRFLKPDNWPLWVTLSEAQKVAQREIRKQHNPTSSIVEEVLHAK